MQEILNVCTIKCLDWVLTSVKKNQKSHEKTKEIIDPILLNKTCVLLKLKQPYKSCKLWKYIGFVKYKTN